MQWRIQLGSMGSMGSMEPPRTTDDDGRSTDEFTILQPPPTPLSIILDPPLHGVIIIPRTYV